MSLNRMRWALSVSWGLTSASSIWRLTRMARSTAEKPLTRQRERFTQGVGMNCNDTIPEPPAGSCGNSLASKNGFSTNTNHTIAKRLVETAQRSVAGIALEDLTGLRERVKARRQQRPRHANWGFAQLRQYVTYKAAIAGVPVILVDPRHTSQECNHCGHIAKANRPTQNRFSCHRCGYTTTCGL